MGNVQSFLCVTNVPQYGYRSQVQSIVPIVLGLTYCSTIREY